MTAFVSTFQDEKDGFDAHVRGEEAKNCGVVMAKVQSSGLNGIEDEC